MGAYRNAQIAVSVLLLAATFNLYLFQPDWWIYGLASGASGLLNLGFVPGSKWWRLFSSVVIVLGSLEVLFLAWVFRGLSNTPLFVKSGHNEAREELPEARYLLLVSSAVALTISSRLFTAELHGFLDCLRSLLLLAFLTVICLVGTYAVGFYVPQVANFVTHYLEGYHI